MSPVRVSVTGVVLAFVAATVAAAEKPKPEQLLKLHLDEGLGPADARAGHSRLVKGTSQLASRAVGAGTLGGSFQLASDPQSSRLFVQFGTNVYEGETFAFDGKSVEVGFGQRPSGQRSALGNFVVTNEVILREGLLGGVLNAAWPLLALEARQAKLSVDGLKKLDGRELQRASYRAKRGQNDLTIQLFFEPDTGRHVATVYFASRAQDMGRTPVESSQQSDVYERLEERFADFDRADGVMLPRTWTVRYERSGRTTIEWKYAFKVESIETK